MDKKTNKLKPVQLKALSEFANTVATAWFSAGVISPLFVKPENLFKIVILAGLSLLMTAIFLNWSLSILRGVKL